MTTRTTPTLGAVLLAATEARLDDLWVALPARVETYDAATQRCSAQPVVRQAFQDESGDRQTQRLPVVTDVPVAWPGGGGFRLTFPLTPGDYVLLLCTSCSLDRWLVGGGADVDPQDDRRSTLSDAVAIPAVRDFGHPWAPSDNASLGRDGGPTIEITPTEIRAGGTDKLVTLDQFLHHTHVTAGTGAPTPPTAITPGGSAVTFPGTQVLKGG